jgi:hypothetical protein
VEVLRYSQILADDMEYGSKVLPIVNYTPKNATIHGHIKQGIHD